MEDFFFPYKADDGFKKTLIIQPYCPGNPIIPINFFITILDTFKKSLRTIKCKDERFLHLGVKFHCRRRKQHKMV